MRAVRPIRRFFLGAASRVFRFTVRPARFLAPGILAACSVGIDRNPVPEELANVAAAHGIEGQYRAWGDTLDEEDARQLTVEITKRLRDVDRRAPTKDAEFEEVVLVLSGGGADGAFGAGLLNGWTARGDRPEFSVVTGVSTGAVISIFAFLGRDYDDQLKEVYTAYETDDLLRLRIVAGLLGSDSVTSADGYRNLIARYIDDEVMKRLAQEHHKGRTLLIGTTNLDANRPVTWSVSAIAASEHQNAKALVWDIVQASSAIPGVFPSVLIPVIGDDGESYDELHVDGGATNQMTYINPEISLKDIDEYLGVDVDRKIYVVVNSKTTPQYDPVRPRFISVASASASSLISGSGRGDLYRIFTLAQRDEISLYTASVSRDFVEEAEEPFDRAYMKALYDHGYEAGFSGTAWRSGPPGLKPRRSASLSTDAPDEIASNYSK